MRWFSLVTRARFPRGVALEAMAQQEKLFHMAARPFYESYNAIIVGRVTYHSLPRPLRNRNVIVLTSMGMPPHDARETVTTVPSLEYALDYCAHKRKHGLISNIFVAGGAWVYAEALRHPGLESMYITEVKAAYPEADAWWPSKMCYLNAGDAREYLWETGEMFALDEQAVPSIGWHRTHVSSRIATPKAPIRFGVWEKAGEISWNA